MIIAIACAVLALGSVSGRVTTTSLSLTPDALSATWTISGEFHLQPRNFSLLSLQQALRNAVSQLTSESFHVGELAGTRIDAWRLPVVEEQESFMKLVHNIIECALDNQQIAHIEMNEGQVLQIPGLIGMAPEWIQRPIDKDSQEAVSACLAARATFFQTPPVSLRGTSLGIYADSDEETQFSILEGQFWGNIFDQNEALIMSCWSSETIRAWNQARVCSTGIPVGIGRLSCGMMLHMGHCKRFCEGGPESDAPYSIRICDGNPHVVAVYLSEENSREDD